MYIFENLLSFLLILLVVAVAGWLYEYAIGRFILGVIFYCLMGLLVMLTIWMHIEEWRKIPKEDRKLKPAEIGKWALIVLACVAAAIVIVLIGVR